MENLANVVVGSFFCAGLAKEYVGKVTYYFRNVQIEGDDRCLQTSIRTYDRVN